MLKAHEQTFQIAHKLTDSFIALVSWTVLMICVQDTSSIKLSIPLAFLTYYFFARQGLYKSHRLERLPMEIFTLLKANFIACLFFFGLLYFTSDELKSEVYYLYYLISSAVFMSHRMSLRYALRFLRRRGYNIRHVVAVGHGPIIESFVRSIVNFPDAGIKFIAWCDSQGAAEQMGVKAYDGDLRVAQMEWKPDTIIMSYPADESQKVDQLLKENYNSVVPIMILPDIRHTYLGFQVRQMAGHSALIVNQPTFSSVDQVNKRIFDILASGAGLLVLSPVLIILSLMIKLTSKGPIFFSQERVGLDGQKFKMWKFRTMIVDAEKHSMWTVPNDPRRTKMGSFLRSTSLDELPQLFNVFVGQMSLVGPRPEQPVFVEKFRNEIPAYMLRHKMKAGITGWAQVNGWRGDTSLHKRIEYDLYYVKNWSIWLDMQIILLTFWRGLVGKNAY